METSGLAPSRAWYMLAAILVVVAAAVAAGALLMSLRQINFRPITIPGETDINVMTPGTWIVCIESTDGSSPVTNDMHIEFLDPATGADVAGLLLEMNRTRGTTLVVVTHSARMAEQLGRTLVLADGRLEEAAGRAEGLV